MADRVAASITIGGIIPADDYITLCRLIAEEDLSVEDDGDTFTPADRIEGQPLRLFDHQAIGGQFKALEAWCIHHGLAFSRWCAGYTGSWQAERVVFTGEGFAEVYPANEKGTVVATLDTLNLHQNIATLRAWFAAADFEVPPLVILVSDDSRTSEFLRASAEREESGEGGSEHCSQLQKGSAQ